MRARPLPVADNDRQLEPNGTAGRPSLIRFLAAATISFYGDWLTTVALVVMLYQVTGSAIAPAGYILVRVAPRPFGSGPGGVLADRMRPARAGALVALLQGLLTLALILAAQSRTVWMVYALVAIIQFLGAMARPIALAVLAQLAPQQDRPRINQIYSILLASALFVAPAVGAVLLPVTGARGLLLVDAISFFVACGLLLSLATISAGEARGLGLRKVFGAGIGSMLGNRDLRLLGAGTFACGASITALQAVLVVAAAERFGGPERVGWCYAAVGAGGILGSLLAIWDPFKALPRPLILAGVSLELGAVILFALIPVPVVGLALLAASSLGGTVYQISGNVVVQSSRPEWVGRVSGAVATSSYAGMLVGAILAIGLSARLTWPEVVIGLTLAGFALVLFSLVSAQAEPRPADRDPRWHLL